MITLKKKKEEKKQSAIDLPANPKDKYSLISFLIKNIVFLIFFHEIHFCNKLLLGIDW